MIQEKLKPAKFSDIVFRMSEYLEEMRKMDNKEEMEFVNFLDNYVREYFSDFKDEKVELKKTIAEVVDNLYVQIMSFEKRDIHTDGYFGIVLNRLFWELAKKEIHAFFIVDNAIRDDRFKLLIELFKVAHFAVVYPYEVKNLEHSLEYTKYSIKNEKDVEEEIGKGVKEKKHILYVEKDDSVNYLNDILSLAEDLQELYLCIFRNQSIETYKTATLLMGSFGDILKKESN